MDDILYFSNYEFVFAFDVQNERILKLDVIKFGTLPAKRLNFDWLIDKNHVLTVYNDTKTNLNFHRYPIR